MGARCSSGGIVMPSKKFDNNNIMPVSERGRRNSASNPKGYSSEQATPKGIISAEKTTSVTIKQRRVQTEANEGSQKFDSSSPLNDTNNSRSTEITNVRGLYQYKKGPLIGKGSYGEVYECLNLNTGELLAVKSFKVHGDLAKVLTYIENLKKEVVILKNLSHENIVKYYTTEITDVRDGNHATVDIVQEYVSGGSVRKLLDKFNKLEEKVVGTYVRQVLHGLHYLHMQGILHRNIKGSNILIDTSGTIKLTEFGYSGRPDRITDDGTEVKSNAHRTPAYWSAPEVVLKKSSDMPADIWSVGCIVIEMLTGSPPWAGQIKNMDDFVKKMNVGAVPAYPLDISEACRDFLQQTLKHDPQDRPTVIDLLEHPFVREEDNMNNSSYMEAESIAGGGLSRTHTPGNFLNLLDGRTSDRPFQRQRTNNLKRQDSDATSTLERQDSHLGNELRQNSGYKDLFTGFHSGVPDSANGVSRQNTEDKNTIAMFKAYGFDATSRQNSSNKEHIAAFKANAIDATSRQNSDNKGMLAAFKAEAMDFRMKTENAKNLANFMNNLRDVEEERDEDENSPHPNNKEMLRFGSGVKNGQEPKSKEDIRRELEDKMMRDLMRMNTHNLEELGLQEENEENETDRSDNKMKNGSPIKNTLVDNLDSSRKKQSLVSEVDFNNKKVMALNENDVEQMKKKLREEFEAQLEYSLARINTEKLSNLIEKEFRDPPSVERGSTLGAKMIRENLKTDHSADNNDNNPIWSQNFGDDVLGSFRGFSENNNYELEHNRNKNISPRMTDSERSSPNKGKKMEFRNPQFEHQASGQESDRLDLIPEIEEAKQSNSIINIKNLRQVQTQAV